MNKLFSSAKKEEAPPPLLTKNRTQTNKTFQ